MTQAGAPTKRDVMLALLEQSSVYVHLDPRRAGVVVPPQFKRQPQLVLQVGLNLAVAIRDLDVGEEAVGCTLSFNRSPFYCVMPWTSIFGLVGADDQRGRIWPDDVPAEIAAQVQTAARRDSQPKERTRLRAVKSSDEEGDDEAETESAAPPRASERPSLTIAPPPPPEPAKAVPTLVEPAAAEPAPVPAAVPAPAAAPVPAPLPAPAVTEHDEGDEPTPPDAEPSPPGRGKRPIPSYLRVVK